MTTHKPPTVLDSFRIRACYADTDSAGVIHHARILEFFERSRTEWLDSLGAGPRLLEDKLGLLLVIREVILRFHRPGNLDDILGFSHRISHRGNSQFTLEQAAFRVSTSAHDSAPAEENCIASGTFQIVCVSLATMKSHPLPAMIEATIKLPS